MAEKGYELPDDALENVLGGVNVEELKSMSLPEREKLARLQERELQDRLAGRSGEPDELGKQLAEMEQSFREDFEDALGRVDKQADLLKESVDNLLKINAEISRNI